MLDVKKSDEKIEVKKENSFLIFLFVCIFLTIMLSVGIISGIVQNGTLSGVDIFMYIFSVVSFVLFGIYGYTESKMRLIIDSIGVNKITPWKSQTLLWTEIEDFGVSYCGRSKTSTYYSLYFSSSPLKEKNEYSKKLRGKIIKFVVERSEYDQLISVIIPYCKDRTPVSPFVGNIKHK